MTPPQRTRFNDGRWHFQHGPIDCIVAADGDGDVIARAIDAAWQRFGGVLAELMGEIDGLRADLSSSAVLRPPELRGAVARRMADACRPHAQGGTFITAMAAVAGSVADELIGFFDDARIHRAYVNNGGDIALHLMPGAHFDVGLVARPDAARLGGRMRIDAGVPIRGIATSGWRGRSFSLGIADSVTVLAATAAQADAAATLIANAVDVDDHRIRREPADQVRDDSDLGHRLVTRDVPALPAAAITAALAAGLRCAQDQLDRGLIAAAVLGLQGHWRQCGSAAPLSSRPTLPPPAWRLQACSTPPRPPTLPSMSASSFSTSKMPGTTAARAPAFPCSAAASPRC